MEGTDHEDVACSVSGVEAVRSTPALGRHQSDGRGDPIGDEAPDVLWSDRYSNHPANLPRPLGARWRPRSDLRPLRVRAARREDGCRRNHVAVALWQLHELGRPDRTGHRSPLRAGHAAGNDHRAAVVPAWRARRGSVWRVGGAGLRPGRRWCPRNVDRDRPEDAQDRGEPCGSPHAEFV